MSVRLCVRLSCFLTWCVCIAEWSECIVIDFTQHGFAKLPHWMTLWGNSHFPSCRSLAELKNLNLCDFFSLDASSLKFFNHLAPVIFRPISRQTFLKNARVLFWHLLDNLQPFTKLQHRQCCQLYIFFLPGCFRLIRVRGFELEYIVGGWGRLALWGISCSSHPFKQAFSLCLYVSALFQFASLRQLLPVANVRVELQTPMT